MRKTMFVPVLLLAFLSQPPVLSRHSQRSHFSSPTFRSYCLKGFFAQVYTFSYQSGPRPFPLRLPHKTRLNVVQDRIDARFVTPGPYFTPGYGTPVDYYRLGATEYNGCRIGRSFLYLTQDGNWGISMNYELFRKRADVVSMVALGERLLPSIQYDRRDTDIFHCDVSSVRAKKQSWRNYIHRQKRQFATRRTGRWAIGFSTKKLKNADGTFAGNIILVHIVKSPRATLPQLRHFMNSQLGCYFAVNLDGGSSYSASYLPIAWCDQTPRQYAQFLGKSPL